MFLAIGVHFLMVAPLAILGVGPPDQTKQVPIRIDLKVDLVQINLLLICLLPYGRSEKGFLKMILAEVRDFEKPIALDHLMYWPIQRIRW